jgi:NADPH:quinone reductase-like Zn-dependent oxidoreductase
MTPLDYIPPIPTERDREVAVSAKNLRDLAERTVLVTGASLGIGRATARAFHQAGSNVVLVARR